MKLGFIGLGISMYPSIVPESVTIWQAAAPESSQLFMLVGTAVIIPVILIYTGWAYWVFRGKVGTHGPLSTPNPAGSASPGSSRSGPAASRRYSRSRA